MDIYWVYPLLKRLKQLGALHPKGTTVFPAPWTFWTFLDQDRVLVVPTVRHAPVGLLDDGGNEKQQRNW